jgi:hypothetical protein
MIVGNLTKQPFEEFPVSANFAAELADGETITDAVVTAKRQSDGVDTTATILNGTRAIATPLVTQPIKAGASGERHVITMKVTTSATPANKWEVEIIVNVREIEFT